MELYKAVSKYDQKLAEEILEKILGLKVELDKMESIKDTEKRLELEKIESIKDTEKRLELKIKDTEKRLELEKMGVIIEKKDSELMSKNKELLSSRGALTARGIFEFYVNSCVVELQKLGICTLSEKFNVSNIISKMSDKENQHKLPVDGYCIKLLNMAKQSRVSLKDVYMQLSKDVHGSSWSGPSVLVYADTLSQQEKCFIELVADRMNLIIKEVK